MTNISWLMNSEASRLSSAVPASERRSENRLGVVGVVGWAQRRELCISKSVA